MPSPLNQRMHVHDPTTIHTRKIMVILEHFDRIIMGVWE
jgi:hypothetical protein